MGWISSFFSSNDGLHQVVRTGGLVTDLSTGQSGFVLSDDNGFSMITDQRGTLHQIVKNGGMTTDLTTGATYFESDARSVHLLPGSAGGCERPEALLHRGAKAPQPCQERISALALTLGRSRSGYLPPV